MGQVLASGGNTVTVLTGNSLLKLPLDKKKIGLLQIDGMGIIAFNIPYYKNMNRLQKYRALNTYNRWVLLQGRRLPRPDFIIASSPPLTASIAALKLSRHHKAPLILEIWEIWPDALIQRGTLNNKAIIAQLRRWEQKVYAGASRIIAASTEIANLLRDKQDLFEPIDLLPEIFTGDELISIWGGKKTL